MPWGTEGIVKNEKSEIKLPHHTNYAEGWLLVSQWKGTHCRGKDDNETPYQEGRRHINEQAILIQDVDEGQIVPFSNLVVIMVMGWGDFDGAWTESGTEGHER